MTYEDIKDFAQRCEEHPAHQNGMVSYQMIQARLEEEIDELREYIEALAQQEPERFCDANCTWSDHHPDCKYGTQNSDELTIAYMSGLYDGKKQANPEQEPVAWMDADGNVSDNNDHKCFPIPLYTVTHPTPTQRKPLTDEQIRQVMRSLGWTGEGPSDIEFARAIEAAHGIGNKT